jgi:predicted amino acid dehydrogenase
LLRQAAEALARRAGLELKECTVAVVGAAGLVGSLTSKLLADRVGKLILVDRRVKVLNELGEELSKQVKAPVLLSKGLSLTQKADVIVAATNAISAVLSPAELPAGTLIIDDSRPTSTPLNLMEQRPDIVEGGVGYLSDMKCSFDFGLLHKNEVFGCLGESILLCWDSMYEHRHLEGKNDLELALELEKLALEVGFDLAEFQWQGRAIHSSQFDTVRAARTQDPHPVV